MYKLKGVRHYVVPKDFSFTFAKVYFLNQSLATSFPRQLKSFNMFVNGNNGNY